MSIYIYIYRERERERDAHKDTHSEVKTQKEDLHVKNKTFKKDHKCGQQCHESNSMKGSSAGKPNELLWIRR